MHSVNCTARVFRLGGIAAAIALSLAALSRDASAAIYKYTKKNGTVAYTDNIGDLPPDRQAHYLAIERQREAERAELERKYGKEGLAKKEADEKKRELAKAAIEERERQKRTQAIDRILAAIRERHANEDRARLAWQTRLQSAKKSLTEKLADFAKTRESRDAIAIVPDYTRLPGQTEELQKLDEKLALLEKEIDALIEEIEVTIPTEARQAGVPPGWLR